MSELIPLSLIYPNPFQPREAEDPEHVANVAESIATQGLLQTPVGRKIDIDSEEGWWGVQLAFGHTRLAAYRMLQDRPGTNGYGAMPVVIQDLDDQQMFELAITENLARKNLTPIEEARAMKTYKEKFGKTSVEIGKLFGLSDSAVRNKLRLLDLPETVQDKIAGGEITEGTARKLMVLDKVAPERVENIAEQITSNEIEEGATVSKLIQVSIEDSFKQKKTGLQMWNGRWNKGEPRAGEGLWSLTWTPGILDGITPKQFRSAFPEWEEDESWILKEIQNHLSYYPNSGPESMMMTKVPADTPLKLVQAGYQLIRPPACTACRFHSAIDGIHYCQIKVCWQNKRKAWYEAELERISQEMGIPIYDKSADGNDYESYEGWYRENEKKRWEAWIDEKADHLRLKIKYQEWREHLGTNSHVVQLVSVRNEYQKRVEKERLKREKERAERKAESDDWEAKRQRKELSQAFMWEYAAKFFAPVFEPIKSGVLPYVAKAISGFELNQYEIPEDPKERDQFYRIFIAYQAMDAYAGFDEHAAGPIYMADYLMGIAKTWGIDLPDEFAEVAHEFNISEEEPA